MPTALDSDPPSGGAVPQTWEYTVAVETADDGSVVASCAELGIEGVRGASEDEALESIAAIIAEHLETALPNL